MGPVAKILVYGTASAFALLAALALALLIALALAYPNLPDVSELQDYQPKLPLRIYTSEGQLIGEFGQERRELMPIGQIPKVMKDAVLAVEDARFYEHSGVDYIGVARAALANLGHVKSQGASTITMQVARNVYLSSEKTYTRKIYETLLTFKLEHLLSKDQILEIYMNQIFLGYRSYGFAAASETYFGKPLKDISLAEAAMLAGIPQSPSAANPIRNFDRARTRQLYILDRMVENGFITSEQAEEAKTETIVIRSRQIEHPQVHAQYVAEMVRQTIVQQYGEQAYNRGLKVYTSINTADQEAAYRALRRGILNYERKQVYRGPETFIDLPKGQDKQTDAIDEALAEAPDLGDLTAAVVTQVNPGKITAVVPGDEQVQIGGAGLVAAQSGLNPNAAKEIRIRPGAVIRIIKNAAGNWETAQIPAVEGALVALDPRNGAIKALVGGFDFASNKFNHVTQAWRQPGSTFKPFIYSAALEKGFSPSTVVNDAPLTIRVRQADGSFWTPKNYEGGFQGPITFKQGLVRSRNMVSIRILQAITPRYGQEWVSHFGFDRDKHLPYLPMALGAGSVTPLQMAAAFSVFGNGGYRVNPMLITRITDHTGRILLESKPQPPSEDNRAIDVRNAFIMSDMLQEVTRTGTAAQAQRQLGRSDLYGKTGTTNDAFDAWFVGYQPTLAAAVWIGYDMPRNLGARETGGGLSLPIWVDFMRTALKDVPVRPIHAPAGVSKINGNWSYNEYARGGGISNYEGAGLAPNSDPEPATPPPSAYKSERDRILDLFND